ncbi:MAG: Peptide deformylase [Alphaproteobacteria bacterium MarineAlpha11_Bin1]|nr:MAG: Peptide deformylase [Alphaproteobacteria bacterium MarineAlpha11_Bin1]|tara:strand:- start:10004 stop:10585 length:582 start_codon:yes stop_codon:yes gene_type:complete
MTLLKIARMGHPVLLQVANEIQDPTSQEVGSLLQDMVETMEDAVGVGLAAPQVYEGKRAIIFKSPRERGDEEGSKTDFSELTALINPEFEPASDELAMGWEGCLSIPGITGVVPRYSHIIYRGYLASGQPIEREATNFHARVVQHEIDHLDGVLFPMRMTDLSLLSFNEELKKFMENTSVQDAVNSNDNRPEI